MGWSEIGKAFQDARIASGYTQDQLARDWGYTRSHLANFEQGHACSLVLFIRYCEKFPNVIDDDVEVIL